MVTSYRAGYSAADRRRIEGKLAAGELRGLVSTNALELGIDVGELDATVHVGVPAHMHELWQQVRLIPLTTTTIVSCHGALAQALNGNNAVPKQLLQCHSGSSRISLMARHPKLQQERLPVLHCNPSDLQYPWDASAVGQAGRAGRRNSSSLAIVVAQQTPLARAAL